MAKVISYKLTSSGEVPSFVTDGGYYPTTQNWQTMVLVGVAKDTQTVYEDAVPVEVPLEFLDGITVYETKEEFIAYLDTYTSDWETLVSLEGTETTPFSSAEAADALWAKLA